jgi:hypothetical protein
MLRRCNCDQRREALADAVKALKSGDMPGVKRSIWAVASSAGDDLKALAQAARAKP